MKSLLCIALIFSVAWSATGQELAYTGSFAPKNYLQPLPAGKKKCTATRVGTVMMITGAVVAVGGAIAIGTPLAKNNDPDHTEAGIRTATGVAVAGASCAAVGVVLYLIGKDHDGRQKKHASVTWSGNNLGVAWNF